MGGVSGKASYSDSLAGASTPPLAGVKLPNIGRKEKRYNVTVPKFKSGGQECSVTVAGQSFTVKIPPGKKENDSFTISVNDITRIYASSLPTLPGMVVLMAKPIIFGSVAEAYSTTSASDFVPLPRRIGQLIQEAQSKILQKAVAYGCNAVLGISFTVSNDSSGDCGLQKIVCVTASGTPCIVNTAEDMPIASVQAFPENNNVTQLR